MLVSLLAPALKSLAKHEVEETEFPVWIIFVAIATVVIGLGVVFLLLALRKNKSAPEPCAKCGKMMMSDWPQCMFCKAPRAVKAGRIEVVSGPLSGQVIALDGDVTTIGSAPGSTITLTDVGVSGKHAGIRKAEGGYELADLGSKNGVYLNGEKVAKRQLRLGDVIRIGNSEMVFKG